MRLQGIDDDLEELRAAEAQLRRVRDTMVSLVGAAIMAFGVLGLHLDIPIASPRMALMIYGGLISVGGLIAVVGVLMGLVGMLRRD